RIEIFDALGLDEVTVEDGVGRGIEPALDQIHEQEGEIVQHVARRDERAELDGVEWHRPSIEKDDVAEMQVAMEAPNQASVSACDEERAKAGMGGVAPLRQRLNLRPREEIGTLAQCGVVLFDIIGEGGDPRLSFDRAGAGVK